MRKSRILFARFVACVEDTRLPKYVMFGELMGGRGLCGGQKKERIKFILDDLRAFGIINADQWTTTVQDEGECMVQHGGTGGGKFHGEMGRCRESQGWTLACSSSMSERDGTDKG